MRPPSSNRAAATSAQFSSSYQVPLWRDPDKRNMFFQILVLAALLILAYIMVSNALAALERQNITSGFDFLSQEAAFGIGDTLISYTPENSFGRALLVGLANTLMVALLGNLLAVIWGTFVGIAQLSSNWMLARLAKGYVMMLRNTPLLLQLFFWYALMTEVLPPVRQAVTLMPYTYLSQRGLVFPFFEQGPALGVLFTVALLGVLASYFIYRWQQRRQERTGEVFPFFRVAAAVIIIPPLLLWWSGIISVGWSVPVLKGFNFQGGITIGPELAALLLGLVLYTGAFIAEIVRSGITAIHRGQWEAASSLGLNYGQTLRLVILPQALRVIIPPLTSQMLNLTKNSSLAVAIGYSDFVNVANTTMNQTGQAIECILLIVVVYLTFSLLTSLFMNWYNSRIQLVT